jgi:hypothetical protein
LNTLKEIKRQEQLIARLENNRSLEKIKARKADTRKKIEFGGLVIKAGMNDFNKDIILGALAQAVTEIEKDPGQLKVFESIGRSLFLETEKI